VLAPSTKSVAGGTTAVVKSAGGKVVSADAQLALSLTDDALSHGERGFFFFFGASPDQGGPEDTESSESGSRWPTSYPGAVAALRTLFAEAPEGGLVARAAKGELPVLIAAESRHEVARACRLAKELGLRGAIYGAPLASEIVEPIRASGLGVVLAPYASGQTDRSRDSLRRLTEAGVPVAFALDQPDHAPESLRLSAAMALGAGADPAAVWRALTSDAARIAGVEDRIGRLDRGADADFVLWSGNPLDLSSRVQAVYVAGELVWKEEGR
jgi:imidazolonepropionase-like amidohydrolase